MQRIPGLSFIFFLVFLVASQYSIAQQKPAALKPIVRGMKITSSTTFRKNIYKMDALDSLTKPVILIEGENITVDFRNSTLQGNNSKKYPNEFTGIAILIRNSKNVTIKNLNIKRYKIALQAVGVEGLTIEHCDLSYNFRQRLNSNRLIWNPADGLKIASSEYDEWALNGAAIYLRRCNGVRISNCRATGGQNALVMVESDDGMVFNNDFSYNSGVGITFYRSSRNKVLYNRANFNVREYSDKIYNEGSGNAGMLLLEGSNNNFIYKNSFTHSGTGIFLF